MLCLAVMALCAQASGAADPSLKLHLDFDQGFTGGQVVDVSGNGNHGWQFNPTNWITVSNGVFGTTGGYWTKNGLMTDGSPNGIPYEGMPSNGFHFYPASQYIGITNLNGIQYLTNGTMSLWARFDSATNGHNASILMDCGYNCVYSWVPSEASNSWVLGKFPYDNSLGLMVYPYVPEGGYRRVVTWPDDTIGGDNESTASIHLYTFTFECPSNRITAYYDGKPYMTNTIDLPWLKIYGTASWWHNWLCIGAFTKDGTAWWGDDMYPNSGYFMGIMDDIRIYNRALDPAEVNGLYLGYGSKAADTKLAARVVADGSIDLSFTTVTNVFYQVESSTNLVDDPWVPLGEVFAGDGETTNLPQSRTNGITRYYRVRPLP